MAYISNVPNLIGKTVKLTCVKESMAGYFEAGSIVKITGKDPTRGYTFEDEYGNKVIEAGFSGFKLIK